jgi:hypothetical protein
MPAYSRVALAVLLAAADAIADSETEPEKPYSIATPNRKNAEEKAPSRKYFIAASCESRRRRLASPHSRYSGSDSTSSATNMVSRSLAAGNSSIPPIANMVSGKISVCMIPAPRASRSSALPGVAAACAANGLLLESPMSSTLAKASTRIVPWMNRVGRSTATAPIAAAWPGLPPAKMAHGRGHHDRHDERGGQRAQRQHHLHAAAERPRHEGLDQDAHDRGGEDDQHRRELAVLDARRGDRRCRRWLPRRSLDGKDPGHGAVPFCAAVVVYPVAGCAGTGSVMCTCAIVTRTAGLMMSSTGLG